MNKDKITQLAKEAHNYAFEIEDGTARHQHHDEVHTALLELRELKQNTE